MATIYGKTSSGATAIYNSPGSLYWQCYVNYTSTSAELWLYVGAASGTSGHLYVNIDSYIGSVDFTNYTNTYMASGESHKLGTVSINPGEPYSFSATCKSGTWGQNGTLSGTIPVQASAPSYNSISAGSVSSSGVTLTASINNGGATITGGGWQLSTNGGTNWTTYSGDWASKTITGLSNSTTYTYRGYATNSAGTTYSSTSTFTTLGPPTYGSAPYTGTIFYNYVELKVDTIQTHGSALTAGGWQLSTDGGSTWTTYAAAMTSTDSPYKKYIYNLSPATGYWYRSYATNSVGTGYSSVGYVTTNAAPPTLASPSITNITATSAELSITCTDTGGKPLTSSNIKVYTTSPFALVTTINGLSGTATGLSPNTEYRAEANASNADNSTSYGMGTFTTLAPSSNVKVSLNGAAFVTGTVKLSQNGGAFVTIPGSKVKTSINGGSF